MTDKPDPFGGFSISMIDEPVEWGAHVDRDAVLDYVFRHQRLTLANTAWASQYGLPLDADQVADVRAASFAVGDPQRDQQHPQGEQNEVPQPELPLVGAMAELQERSRAFDLAIENIYTRTRRVLARYAGMDYNSPRTEIAARVASRSHLDEHKLETLMRQCEEAINGAPLTWRQSIDLVIRGVDLLASTGRQIYLARLLGRLRRVKGLLGVGQRLGAEEPGGPQDLLDLLRVGAREVGEVADPRHEVGHHATTPHRQLAAHEVHGLDAVGALVDRGDAGVPVVLGHPGLLDVAHPAEHLDGEARELHAEVCRFANGLAGRFHPGPWRGGGLRALHAGLHEPDSSQQVQQSKARTLRVRHPRPGKERYKNMKIINSPLNIK